MESTNTIATPAKEGQLSTGQTLGIIGLAGLAIVVIGLIPWLGWVNYPFRLLITMVHELGHGLAAILTGGQFIRFEVSPDGSGLAYTAGGWRLLVIPAGYLGAAIFGAVLIMVGRNARWSRVVMGVIGVAMIYFALRYGTPTMFSGLIFVGFLTAVSGMMFGGIFLWVAFKASTRWVIFWLHVVAIQAGLMAFSDVVTVIGLSTRLFNPIHNDAQSMAQLTFVPAIVWAGLWGIMAVIILGGAIWFTWLAPLSDKLPTVSRPSKSGILDQGIDFD